jgi:predicted permease
MSLLARLRNAFRSDTLSDEIEREMAFHIDQRTEDLVSKGMSPRLARAEARRRFGNVGKHADETRDRDVMAWLATLLADVRHALRVMRVHPGPTIIIGLTLALGMGVNASVLGIMDGLVFRPYQFRDYQRLVVFWDTRVGGSDKEPVAPANFLDWRAQASNVEQLVAWEAWDVTLTGGTEPERVRGFRVSPGFFELIGETPTIGRSFAADEERPGSDRRVVLSEGFWRRRFGADPAIVGKTTLLDDVAYTIVGVAPPKLDFPMATDVWAPLALSPARAADRKNRSLTVMGRLADGRSLRHAQAEMNVIGRRLETLHPETNRDRGISIRTLSTAFTERAAFVVSGVLETAAGLVLLVACANLAGLLLARSIDRRRELAVRIALGASRSRIVRHLVTETVVVSLIASAVAIACAQIGLGVLKSSVPEDVARYVEGWNNIRLDWAIVPVIPALSIAIGVLVALFPALTALRATSPSSLRESDRGTIGSIPSLRGRQALVVVEIAFALAIIVSAGLMVQSGIRMVNTPGGFDADRLLTLDVSLPERKYPDAAARRRFVGELRDRVQAIPGVEDVALANILPANGWSPTAPVLVEDDLLANRTARGDLLGDPTRWPQAGYRGVSDDFFETMRVRILSGRTFTTADGEDRQRVAVVSAAFAERFWPNADPVGKRIRLTDTSQTWLTVVGVVADVNMYNWWDGIDYLAVYVPLRQAEPARVLQTVIRTRGEPTTVTGAVRASVRDIDPTLPVDRVRTMRQAIAENGRGMNLLATLLAVCGAMALLLAVIGIHGLMAYTFAQRTHEFGVRLAFGATTYDLVRLTLQRAVKLTGSGLAVGALLAWALGRAMVAALQGVVALDLSTFVVVALTLALVSLGSAYLPARRALRLDPATILRQ